MLKKLKSFPQSKSVDGIAANRRSHLRPAKNFLGVLGRATKRLSLRNQENLVQRALNKPKEIVNHLVSKPD